MFLFWNISLHPSAEDHVSSCFTSVAHIGGILCKEATPRSWIKHAAAYRSGLESSLRAGDTGGTLACGKATSQIHDLL
jgi:hypothetical protein